MGSREDHKDIGDEMDVDGNDLDSGLPELVFDEMNPQTQDMDCEASHKEHQQHFTNDNNQMLKFEQTQYTTFPDITSPVKAAREYENNSTNAMDEENWESLLGFDIPDYTQTHITNIPQVQALYQTYHASYADPTVTNSARMKRAKALAFVLLKHYYPTSQGYNIEPSSLGPAVKNGLSFILGPENMSEPPNSDTGNLKMLAKKGKKKGSISQKKAPKFNEAAYITKNLFNQAAWYWIQPEDMAAFVVTRSVEVSTDHQNGKKGNMKIETRPFTYLAIIIDDLENLARYLPSNIMHRSDVLADALCSKARLDEGHGILFYGPRIECYAYSAGPQWIWYASDDEDEENTGQKTSKASQRNGSAEEPQDIEPRLALLASVDGEQDLVVDMRTADMRAVDEAMKCLLRREVKWIDGTIVSAQLELNGAAAVMASEMDES